MSKRIRTLAILAVAAMTIMGASGDVITIPENGTLIMGGTGADPNNQRSNYMVFQPGSTLVVTQIGNNATVWTVLVATNGAATIRGPGMGITVNISNHAFVFGDGSLTLENMNYALFGHESHLPTYKLDNLKIGEGVAYSPFIGSSVLTFPTDSSVWQFSSAAKYVVRLFGDTDMFPGRDVISVNSCQVQLCNPAALPAGKKVKVSSGKTFSVSPLVLPDYRDGIIDKWPAGDRASVATNPVTYSCDVSLAAGAKMVFTNSAEVVFDGSISCANAGDGNVGSVFLSGYKGNVAPVVLAGDNSGFSGRMVQTIPCASLILSNANAAANATFVSDVSMTVRGAEGVGAVSVGGVSDGDISDCVLRAAADQTFSVSADEGDVIPVSGDGAFEVDSMNVLKNSASWWFDFSRSNTLYRIGEGSTDAYLNEETSNHEPYIERVVDWRHRDAANSLWNRRLYNSTVYNLATSAYPYPKTDETIGLQYITMGASTTSRRLPFSNGTGYNSVASCSAQLVVMVFGAQSGGGFAMVGTTIGAFGRSGTTINDGMTTNTAHDIWKDGVKIADPTTAKFRDGWQVMSVALDGLKFNGIGLCKDLSTGAANNMGGQNYGEILIFTNAVSERVRLEAEWYLAKKWGLDSQYDAAAKSRLDELRVASPVRVEAAGAPTVRIGDNVAEVGGSFSGTVDLAGGKLLVPDRSLPCTEADIPSEGRQYWADPDDAATILRYGSLGKSDSASRPDEVRAIMDKAARSFTAGDPALYGVGDRMPTVVRQSRGVGAERGWLEFNETTDPGNDGNCLRFLTYPSDSSAVSTLNNSGGSLAGSLLTAVPIRTAFFVQDSVRGGGNPLLNTSGGGTGIARRTERKRSESIWKGDNPAAFTEGENRLDGRTVDYTNGFGGKPEVFTVRGTEAYDASFIGCYLNSESRAKYGEIIGEVLLYSTALSDGAVKDIEAYLMGKWLGRMPEGYADIRMATVTGTGTVEVAAAAQMPKIGSGFEGTVEVADGAFVMNVDVASGTVSSTLDCPLATLDLPQNCSITLNFTGHPPKPQDAVVLTLVNCAGGLDGVTWTFAGGENAPDGTFVKEGNKILYRYAPRGMVFSLR